MPNLRRLDAELVRRKIARSRVEASEWIKSGKVTVGGLPAMKPATQVAEGVSIRVALDAEEHRWASRGAKKLLGALDQFEPHGFSVSGKTVLDAGASTGGFTDVLLDRGAHRVLAVDVGYGQLISRLATDPRVEVFDRTNVRTLTPTILGCTPEIMVGDLSFISLKLVLPALVTSLAPQADLLPMVKPQFEVGKDRLGKGGVVTSAALRAEVTAEVCCAAQSLGLAVRGIAASPLPGPAGNVEYFVWLTKDTATYHQLSESDVIQLANKAVQEGPMGR